ncbi:MAG: ABC transporter permease subunit [Planctomycetes bacterium]|nr:ABC transporter permease subunit [Planctomycetota bacterium]
MPDPVPSHAGDVRVPGQPTPGRGERILSQRLLLGGLLAAVLAVGTFVLLSLRTKHEEELVWGGDQEGGGPYIYPRPDDPNRVVGFEVELMELLAQRLGLRSRFQQGDWKDLPQLLRRGDIDCIANGYELTDVHQADKLATIPYYVYDLQLVARRGASVRSWDSLTDPPDGRKKKVGVLSLSAAEKYTRDRLGDRAEVIAFDSVALALEKVAEGELDATVQDLPALIFYRDRYPTLRFVGEAVGRGYYVIYVRREDERLRDELNAGLMDLIRTGQLRALYERYGLWNPAQEQLGKVGLGVVEKSEQPGAWEVVRRNLPILVKAAGMTVLLSCLAMPLAIIVGLFVAVGRLYGPRPLRFVLAVYVEVLRGTPLMLQLFTIYFVLPSFGLKVPAFMAGVLGLAINYSAYEAEIYRAGLRAIPVGQLEAALALGMSRWQALRRVVIPQAVRIVIPPVTNDFIALFKDTSVCSVITITELTKQYNILANSTGAYLELAAVTAILYLLMSYPLSLLARRLEGRGPRAVV